MGRARSGFVTLERWHDFVDKKLQGEFLAGHIQAVTRVVDVMIDTECLICLKFVDDRLKFHQGAMRRCTDLRGIVSVANRRFS